MKDTPQMGRGAYLPLMKPEETGGKDTYRGFTLYPFQTEAIAAIEAGRSVIVAAPTGAGKTLVADFAIEHALGAGERIVYTSPVKALSNQKYRDFRTILGDDVGIMTGDVTINPEAPLLIMTTEVFRNTIFEDPERVREIGWVVFDEVHYLDDFDRGTVWEESIIFAPEHIRFVCLSATVPNVRELAAWMEKERAHAIDVVESNWRPVPLEHFMHLPGKKLVPIKEVHGRRGRGPKVPKVSDLLDILAGRDLLPCLYFCFSRRDCESLAKANARRNLLSGPEREKILTLFDDLKERYQLADNKQTERLRASAGQGVMYHHAGVLPIYKEIVERLFTSGLIKLLFTTETFALGVNMPARTVVFHMLKKYNGVAFDWLKTRDYYQMAGRAGRQGIDKIGHVVSRLDLRFDDPKEATRLIRGKVEPVNSRFNLSYSGVLSLYDRLGEGLITAYERSFAKFQRERQGPKKGKKGRGPKLAREEQGIRRRLAVLRATGYIDEDGLTVKGRFASILNGYEVQAAELFSYGVYHLADEVQLAMLMVAIVFEERKGDASAHLPPAVLAEIKSLAERRIREFRHVEFEAGLVELLKEPDFRMAGPTHAWARGASLEEIRRLTSISDGDLVRNFRMALQLMRQIKTQVKGDRDLPEKFGAAIAMLDRDEVDARRQLELG
jgi:superfamily II RNA helicase